MKKRETWLQVRLAGLIYLAAIAVVFVGCNKSGGGGDGGGGPAPVAPVAVAGVGTCQAGMVPSLTNVRGTFTMNGGVVAEMVLTQICTGPATAQPGMYAGGMPYQQPGVVPVASNVPFIIYSGPVSVFGTLQVSPNTATQCNLPAGTYTISTQTPGTASNGSIGSGMGTMMYNTSMMGAGSGLGVVLIGPGGQQIGQLIGSVTSANGQQIDAANQSVRLTGRISLQSGCAMNFN